MKLDFEALPYFASHFSEIIRNSYIANDKSLDRLRWFMFHVEYIPMVGEAKTYFSHPRSACMRSAHGSSIHKNGINTKGISMKTSLKMLGLAALVAGFVTSAQAWTYTASGQWAQFNFGNWTVYQDEWGDSTDYCELYANSQYNFGAAISCTGGGIKTYPHTQVNVDIPISSGYYCNSTFNFTGPNNPWWDFFYDAYTGNMQDELEIIEGWNSTGNATWGTEVAANVTIAGKLISTVYQAYNGNNNVVLFGPANQRSSGSEDVMAFFIWSLNNGLLHNSTLHQVSFGTEITYTSGWQQFTVNSYSLNWGQNSSSYHRLQNVATGLYVDGMGRTGNGSDCGQWSSSSSANQSWAFVANGSYVQLQNQATGLMLDGMGRTSNGSTCGQWSNSGSNNQQWSQQSYNGNYRFQNRATGLYMDGMYYTGNGSALCQWSNSGSSGQTFSVQ